MSQMNIRNRKSEICAANCMLNFESREEVKKSFLVCSRCYR